MERFGRDPVLAKNSRTPPWPSCEKSQCAEGSLTVELRPSSSHRTAVLAAARALLRLLRAAHPLTDVTRLAEPIPSNLRWIAAACAAPRSYPAERHGIRPRYRIGRRHRATRL
jgi:hypothetical protein